MLPQLWHQVLISLWPNWEAGALRWKLMKIQLLEKQFIEATISDVFDIAAYSIFLNPGRTHAFGYTPFLSFHLPTPYMCTNDTVIEAGWNFLPILTFVFLLGLTMLLVFLQQFSIKLMIGSNLRSNPTRSGLNHVYRKSSQRVGNGANMLVAVPGGGDDPSGVLVCAENFVIYKNQDPGHPDVCAVIPRRGSAG
ncbi:hypothetical protein Tco_0445791 [Tanacetum coccineum]